MISEKLLLIEDEDRLRRILEMVLTDKGFDVRAAADGQKGIELWHGWKPDAVITDIRMKPLDGFGVLEFGKKHFPDTPVIILTAYGTVETAVRAMKQGAFDFLTKPVNHDELVELVVQALAQKTRKIHSSPQMIGASPAMKQVYDDIALFAQTDSSVLICGESGTGKELAARAIHTRSRRADGPMIRINCAAIPKDLMESELFGHRKGAFTGAFENREGAFVKADRGTLFLDEIGDLPLELQPKLLHAVEEKMVAPVGTATSRRVSVKILSATNLDLEVMIREKRFRSDLFYRLNTVCLTLPPLRERVEDIGLLTRHFLDIFSDQFHGAGIEITPESLRVLKRHPWPGNVRELKNVIERAVLFSRGNPITPESLRLPAPESRVPLVQPPDVSMDLVAQEQQMMLKALNRFRWNQSRAARELGITRSALRYRLQKYGMGSPSEIEV